MPNKGHPTLNIGHSCFFRSHLGRWFSTPCPASPPQSAWGWGWHRREGRVDPEPEWTMSVTVTFPCRWTSSYRYYAHFICIVYWTSPRSSAPRS